MKRRNKQARRLESLQEWLRFVLAQTYMLKEHPELFFQQAANQPHTSAPAVEARKRWEEKTEKRSWIEWINKPQHLDPCVMTLAGHGAGVNDCAYSPDGRRIVSASSDSTLKIWDSKTGAEIVRLAGHGSWIAACAYSPDGRCIVSASADKTLKVWDADSAVEIATLEGHARQVMACAYSPDGHRIASGAGDDTVKIWDAETWTEIATLAGHTSAVYYCAYSPGGRRIVSASYDRTLKIWDAEAFTEVATLKGHSDGVNACAYSPDGRRIVSASKDGTLKIWDGASGAEIASLASDSDFPFRIRVYSACAYSPDGRHIVSSGGGTLRLWDAETWTEIGVAGQGGSFAYSPDGRYIVSAYGDKALKIWDTTIEAEPDSLTNHSARITDCKFSPDNRRVVSASDDCTLKIWDADGGSEIRTLDAHSRRVLACAYSPDGKRIVSASDDNTLKIWDAASGAEVATLIGHSDYLAACAYSPDSYRIASTSDDGTIKIWDADSGGQVATIFGHTDSILACAYSPDGSRIASVDGDTLKIWNAESGAEVAAYADHSQRLWSCSYSPDGKQIIAGSSWDMKVSILDAETAAELTALDGHPASMSPDGRRIVSVLEDNTLKIRDVGDWKQVAVLRGHSDRVRTCAYSPDGRQIISASDDGTIRIWDTESCVEVGLFFTTGKITTLAISRTGQCLAAGVADGYFYILRRVPFEFATPIANIVCLYRFDKHSFDTVPFARCAWCGEGFSPSAKVARAVRDLSKNETTTNEKRVEQTEHWGLFARLFRHNKKSEPLQSNFISYRVPPAEVWDDLRLFSECPHCRKPLRFNPFIVNNSGRDWEIAESTASEAIQTASVKTPVVQIVVNDPSIAEIINPPKRTGKSSKPKIGKNAPCICGSGKKYKMCCGREI